MSRSRQRSRFPQARVLRNSEALLDSGVALIAQEGWGGVSFRSVTRRAGLSPQAIRSRYADLSSLSCGLWQERLSPALEEVISRLVDVADDPGGALAMEELNDIAHLVMNPDDSLKAAADLLLVSQFHPDLQDSVEHSLGQSVARWCRPRAGKMTAASAARRAYLVISGLGLLLASYHPGSSRLDLSDALAPLLEALQEDREPQPLPDVPADQFGASLEFDSGDPLDDAILTSTLEEVADRGYDRTTTARIAANAGCTEGAIFARYSCKLELFNDANRRQAEAGYELNEEYLRKLGDEYGAGVAEAVYMREVHLPKNRHLRALHLESLRVTWHEPKVLKANAREVATAYARFHPSRTPAQRHLDYSISLGSSALPLLDSRCWSLPYDVVLIPFMDLLP